MRAFLAVPASPELKERFALARDQLRSKMPGVKWVDPAGLHLTLQFLGEVAPGRCASLRATAGRCLEGVSPFTCRLGEPGAYGAPAAPRVLWIGVGEGEAELGEVARRLERAVREAGLTPDSRPFSAHWTLGRNRAGRRLPGWREELLALAITGLALDVSGVSLLSSKLLPHGPIYNTEWTVPFFHGTIAPELSPPAVSPTAPPQPPEMQRT